MDTTNNLSFPFPDLDLTFVEGGTFDMGDEKGDLPGDCRPVHRVKVASFYIGKYPVTQGLWEYFMPDNPSKFKGGKRPVENVSWNDTQGFIEKLNLKTGKNFRLPTEAEWEYAARGGPHEQGYTYAGSDKLRQVGWYRENSNGETHEVRLLRPNELGLHDMSGNVWEWCEDRFEENYYKKCKEKGIVENPVNRTRVPYRVIRGGSCFSTPLYCRPAYRNYDHPDVSHHAIGLRLVLVSPVRKPFRFPMSKKKSQ